MLAARLFDKNDLRLEEVKLPEIKKGEVLLQVKSAAICGTDVRMYRNGHPQINPQAPRIPGHELSGVIAAVGNQVKDYKVGMRVAVAPNMGCGICNACVGGNGHLCRDYRALGIHLDGGFAEFTVLPEEAVSRGNITELSKNITFEEAAINEALSCVYNGFLKCDIRPGDRVLVIGTGPIGIMHGKLAKMAGASRVYMSDVVLERLNTCKEMDSFFTTVKSDILKETILEDTVGEGVDVCITACPVPEMQALSLELAAVNGRINFFGGLSADKQNVILNTNQIHYKQLVVTGTTRASIVQFRKTLEFIAAGSLYIRDLITGRFPLKEIHQGFSLATQASGMKNIITMDESV